MSEYWLSVLDEIQDQAGVDLTADQRRKVSEMLESAASVRGEYTTAYEKPASKIEANSPSRKAAWWEDRSQLCGSDWVLSGRIHDLINSRYS